MTSAAADRENRALETACESLVGRLSDVRTAISGLIAKLENDPHLNWHSFLDSYALISGQMNTLLKNVKSERTPVLKKYISLPILLSPERDEELAKLTEQRVATFSHEVVPHYLRTKPDPEVESKHSSYEAKALGFTTENLNKMQAVLEKVTQSVTKRINSEKEDIESRFGARSEIEKTSLPEDTMELTSAVTYGLHLRPMAPQPSTMPMASPPTGNNQSRPQGSSLGKIPSTVKTTIKAANQVHPYTRN